MVFEWDEAKNELNKRKHDGISFEIALRVFGDPKMIDRLDYAHSTLSEERRCAIGLVEDVLFVVFTERSDRIRIISARKATKSEVNEYYKDYDFR